MIGTAASARVKRASAGRGDQMAIVSKKIRNAARGEECCFQIVGVCNHNPETTVLCHLPDESKGMGLKADDLSAAFGCHECHSTVDGRRPWPESEEPYREWYSRRAMVRTWRRLVELGVIKIG